METAGEAAILGPQPYEALPDLFALHREIAALRAENDFLRRLDDLGPLHVNPLEDGPNGQV